jgi:hypothetical protein
MLGSYDLIEIINSLRPFHKNEIQAYCNLSEQQIKTEIKTTKIEPTKIKTTKIKNQSYIFT